MSAYIFLCEDSIDGVFSGIYDAWESRLGHQNIRLQTVDHSDNYSLFCEYITVPADPEKSSKVAHTLKARLGYELYRDLCQAISAFVSAKDKEKEIGKAEAVYKTVVLGLSLSDGGKVMNQLANPYVNRVFQLCRAAGNEAHRLLGFLRFQELENGILFAKVHPQHDVLTTLASHFTDRLPSENFMIYDELRKKAAIHQADKRYVLADVPEADEAFMNSFSEKEQEYQKLWISFFHTIAIEARKNPKLQNNLMPKRFRGDLTEFS